MVTPEPLEGRPHVARDPCPDCLIVRAVLVPQGSHQGVYCARCRRWLYWAPKTETGEAPRTVATLRKGLKPSQQARILERDLGRCVMCGTRENLQIAHFLSVKDGLTHGVPDEILESDENKATMCEACNLGLHEHSVTARFYVAIMVALLRTAEAGNRLSRTAPRDQPVVGD